MRKTTKLCGLFIVALTLILSLTVTTVATDTPGYVAQSFSTSTKASADLTSALKSSHGNNALSSVAVSSAFSTGHTANAVNSYVITDQATSNQYVLLHNNGVTETGGYYVDLFINKKISYNANLEQYVVYDFDLTRLGNFTSNFTLSSITRSADNKTAYFCGGFYVHSSLSGLEIEKPAHITVVYDFNNNKSYIYANNTLLGSMNTGVMSADGYAAWKAGATVNHNSLRLMNTLMNLAIDNVTARYITNDSSLKSSLSSSLSSWSGAIYSQGYAFQEVHPIAVADGQKLYFEEDLASILGTYATDDSISVEIYRDLDTPLHVARNAVIETHGLNCNITVDATSGKTVSGSVVTVKTNSVDEITTVTMPSIFQSGMVFQRGEPITVRGYCKSENTEIQVTLGNITRSAVTDKNGEWETTFEAMSATKGLTMTVEQLGTTDGKAPLVYTNIDIGDVFLLSGQSNMDYNVQWMEDYEELKANANNYHNIRGYLSDNVYRHGEDGIGSGKWYNLTSDTIAKFPAYGYVIATRLSIALDEDITIAIVEASYPGSIIKTWIDADVYLDEYGNDTNYSTYLKYLDFYQTNGRCPTSASELDGWIGRSYQQVLASCYDSIIAPLEGYRVKAVVWDQGSGDLGRVGEYAEHYALLQKTINQTLRTENVPFIMHNLVPRGYWRYKDFLIEQYNIAANDPYTHLVSVGLDGAIYNTAEWLQNPDLSYTFVHTSRKSPLGIRSANVILEKIYGIDSDVTPLISSVTVNGSSLILTATENLTIAYAITPLTFEIAGSDGVYKKATATINGNTITLTADGVLNPQKVRYAYSDLVIELQDGTIIEVGNQYSNCTMTASAIIITASDGTVYEIRKDQYDAIRSYCTGNVTSTAGAPLPAFELEAGYKAN